MCRYCLLGPEMVNGCGRHTFASRTSDHVRNWDGDFMFGKNLASSRFVRVGVLGLVSIAAVVATSDGAQARRSHHRHYVRHAHESYSPAFSSIIVDGNSGATLAANNTSTASGVSARQGICSLRE